MTTATVNEGLGVKQKKSRKSKTDDGTLLPTSTLGVPQTSKEHVANDDQLTKSTIKSKSKRSKGEEGAVSAHTTNEAVTEQRPKKKKRKRTADGDEAQVEGLDIDGESKKKKKREKKAVSDDDEEVGDQVGDQSALKVADSDDIPAEVFQSEKATKKEKKKRRKESQSEGAQALDDTLEPKKKKKRSGNTDFPDPEDDASLTDQARKGLLYVFSQFEDPDAWKFNKARQNWLIRNVWSDQIIPELYLPLVSKYLANVKGGVRENLIQQCREAQTPSVSALPGVDADPPKPTSKQQRTQIILGALCVES